MLMRRLLGIMAVFIFVGTYVLFSQEKPKFEGPHIQFNETKYDFGVVGQDKILEHIFTFRNTGTDTLRVHKVKSS